MTPPAAPRPSAAPCRVLVADDNPDAADSLALFLGLLGHQTRTAYTGPDALATADAFAPDAVFLGLKLAGVDGVAVARELAGRPDGTRPRLLVALSGFTRDDDRKRALAAGCHHYFLKPVNPADLAALLESGCGPA